jgi:hypothetical protein
LQQPAFQAQSPEFIPQTHLKKKKKKKGRDQEDCSWKLTLGKQFMSPYLKKKTYHKKGLIE